MKWSWPIARFAGIDVKIHATFLLIVVQVAVAEIAPCSLDYSCSSGFIRCFPARVVVKSVG